MLTQYKILHLERRYLPLAHNNTKSANCQADVKSIWKAKKDEKQRKTEKTRAMLEKLRESCRGEFSADGEVLTDLRPNGKERPWQAKKKANEALADVYDCFDECKASRLRDCGKLLQFRLYGDGTKELHTMTSCRIRLCPICSWRRSLKCYHNTETIVNHMLKEKEYSFLMLTLTVRNVKANELSKTCDDMFDAIHRLYLRPEWKKIVKGAVRCFEITHNVNRKSRYFDTYHPHFHLILAVNPSYFTDSRLYLRTSRWKEIWKQLMHLDYMPIVNVKKCYGDFRHAVAECSKYACKSVEYLCPEDWDMTLESVKVLDKVLHRRRLIAYTGIFKTLHKLLNLDDCEDGDLINVGDTDRHDITEAYTIQSYYWYTGYRQYISID